MRYLLLLILSLIVFECTAQTNSDPTDAEAVQSLINDNEFENAIARVDVALKKDKKNPTLLLQRGLILVKLDRLTDALTHYKKIRRKLKNNPEPGNNIAMVYRLQGKYYDAVKQFRTTIRKYPDYANAYENLGDTYVEMAKIEYERGLEQEPASDILSSKALLGSDFNQVAYENTPAAKRQTLTDQSDPGTPEPTIKPASAEDEILNTLSSWITNWSNRDVDNFLAHYSTEYIPQNNMPLPEWLGRKSEAISQAKFIRIKLDDIKISQATDNEVIAVFLQQYESDRLTNKSIKSLKLRRYEGRWLIVQEESRTVQ